MKHCLILILFFVAPFLVQADTLDDILGGKYDAETLSEAQMDSLLGNVPAGRYRLEYTHPQPLFRRSFLADYTILDTLKQTRKPLTDCAVRDAVMSPNGAVFISSESAINSVKLLSACNFCIFSFGCNSAKSNAFSTLLTPVTQAAIRLILASK